MEASNLFILATRCTAGSYVAWQQCLKHSLVICGFPKFDPSHKMLQLPFQDKLEHNELVLQSSGWLQLNEIFIQPIKLTTQVPLIKSSTTTPKTQASEIIFPARESLRQGPSCKDISQHARSSQQMQLPAATVAAAPFLVDNQTLSALQGHKDGLQLIWQEALLLTLLLDPNRQPWDVRSSQPCHMWGLQHAPHVPTGEQDAGMHIAQVATHGFDC
jgi:hypothetical protein